MCTGSNGEFVHGRNAEALWKGNYEEAQGLRAHRVNLTRCLQGRGFPAGLSAEDTLR